MLSKRFSAAARLDSLQYAVNGIVAMLRTQHNAWLHALATVGVCAVAAWLGISSTEWCCIILTMVAVWTAEALNTALECLANAVAPCPHPLVRKAKDVAAGAVLLAAVGSVVIGVLVLGPHLLTRLG